MSQEQLKELLKLSRPISISKWERGEAPVPVHHWRALMRVLEIPPKRFLDAARKDHHRQLPLFLSLTGSIQESAAELGSFTWDVIMKNLAPDMTRRLEELLRKYPDLTPAEFAKSAWQYFLEQARLGLDRNNRPIVPPNGPAGPPAGLTDQRPARSTRRPAASR